MGYTTEEEIVDILKTVDLSGYPEPSKLLPLAQVLWALEVTKDKTQTKRITSCTVSYMLSNLKEINLNEISVTRALAKAEDKVKCTTEGKKRYYEIMAPGREFLRKEQKDVSENGVLFFTGENAWSDLNKNFTKLLEMIKGDLCVVDPYYGRGTFHVLEKFGKTRKIRFLTGILGKEDSQNQSLFENDLGRFRNEYKNIELKKCNNPYDLHDRYIIGDNAIIVVGHGIKDLAKKESFVIYLPKEKVNDFLPTIKSIFEERWKKAANIT